MAKAFRFRLQTVQRLRQEARDRQRRALAEANANLSAATAVQSRIAEDLRENVRQLREEKTTGVINVATLRAGYLHQGFLIRKLEEALVTLHESKEAFASQQKILGEANARLKAIEKLRERKWRRHQSLIRREEQMESDEIALRMAGAAATVAMRNSEAMTT